VSADDAGASQAPGSHVAILTRPAGQSAELAECLLAQGWQVYDWPALLLTGLPAIDVPQPSAFDLVMCVSGNAVRFYFEQLAAARGTAEAAWPRDVPIAVVGPTSAAAVRAASNGRIDVIAPPLDAPSFDSEALWARLQSLPQMPRKVLIVRGGEGPQGHGRSWLAERLVESGAQVTLHAAYRRTAAIWPAQRMRQLRAWRASGLRPVWHVSSREALTSILQQVGTTAAIAGWAGSRIVVPHARIAQALVEIADSCGAATRVAAGPGTAADPACIVIQTSMPTDAAVFATIVN